MTALQTSLFDAAAGRRQRDRGKAQAAAAHGEWLDKARQLAVSIARAQGYVSADDLRAAGLVEPAGASFNVFGSVFSGDHRFVSDGFIRSARPKAHANLLHRWRLS